MFDVCVYVLLVYCFNLETSTKVVYSRFQNKTLKTDIVCLFFPPKPLLRNQNGFGIKKGIHSNLT